MKNRGCLKTKGVRKHRVITVISFYTSRKIFCKLSCCLKIVTFWIEKRGFYIHLYIVLICGIISQPTSSINVTFGLLGETLPWPAFFDITVLFLNSSIP